MPRTILYHVTYAPNRKDNRIHLQPPARFVACVKAREDNETFRAYHLDNGRHLIPDYAAIRAALPHYHRAAFDRARTWWFPLALHSAISGLLDLKNSATKSLYDAKGRLLGTLYATPYLFAREGE